MKSELESVFNYDLRWKTSNRYTKNCWIHPRRYGLSSLGTEKCTCLLFMYPFYGRLYRHLCGDTRLWHHRGPIYVFLWISNHKPNPVVISPSPKMMSFFILTCFWSGARDIANFDILRDDSKIIMNYVFSSKIINIRRSIDIFIHWSSIHYLSLIFLCKFTSKYSVLFCARKKKRRIMQLSTSRKHDLSLVDHQRRINIGYYEVVTRRNSNRRVLCCCRLCSSQEGKERRRLKGEVVWKRDLNLVVGRRRAPRPGPHRVRMSSNHGWEGRRGSG